MKDSDDGKMLSVWCSLCPRNQARCLKSVCSVLKLRLGEVKDHAQGHTANQCRVGLPGVRG